MNHELINEIFGGFIISIWKYFKYYDELTGMVVTDSICFYCTHKVHNMTVHRRIFVTNEIISLKRKQTHCRAFRVVSLCFMSLFICYFLFVYLFEFKRLKLNGDKVDIVNM